jgi:murein DD-endopeptidase MepM/ murein hydrolase activator NlpD
MPSFTTPIPGALITSGWGDPRDYRDGKHFGLDFRAVVGTPVKAIGGGKVVQAKAVQTSNAGKWIGIDHGGGWVSRYLHLDSVGVTKGQQVSKGQHIGYSGSTGIERSAAHLHFDLAVSDPSIYPYGTPWGGFFEKDWWGYNVPSEPFVPGNYSDKVKANAAARGIPMYVGISLAAIAIAGGAAVAIYYVWKS